MVFKKTGLRLEDVPELGINTKLLLYDIYSEHQYDGIRGLLSEPDTILKLENKILTGKEVSIYCGMHKNKITSLRDSYFIILKINGEKNISRNLTYRYLEDYGFKWFLKYYI